MLLRNTPSQWAIIAKSLHWLMAILIFVQLVGGHYMASLTNHYFSPDHRSKRCCCGGLYQ